MKIQRYSGNPIVVPGKFPWRAAVVFNPGAWYEDGKFYLFERVAPSIRPLKSQVGLLESEDGFHFRHVVDHPVFTPDQMGRPMGSNEDPRIVKIEGVYYMAFAHRPFTYDCYPTGLGVPEYKPLQGELDTGINYTRSGLASSTNLCDWKFVGFTTPDSVDDRDNVLFPEKIAGRFALLRRPMSYVGPKYGCPGPSMWLSYSDDLTAWTEPGLIAHAENEWEGGKIGAAAPPLRTDAGWLTLYHGVDKRCVYRVGVMLLDLKNPQKVLARCPHFIMEPESYHERFGLIIPNVIFPTGNVIKDGLLYIYYGCCDTCISVATVPVHDVLDELMKFRR